MLMGCSKGSAVRLAPSSLLCAQTGRAWDWDCARGPVAARVGQWLGAWAWDCARGPVDDGVRGAGAVRAGQCLGAWASVWARGPFYW